MNVAELVDELMNYIVSMKIHDQLLYDQCIVESSIIYCSLERGFKPTKTLIHAPLLGSTFQRNSPTVMGINIRITLDFGGTLG